VTLDRTKLSAARLLAAGYQPYLAVALYALDPIEEVGLGTFAVDGRWRLFVDPEALDRWSVEEVAGVLLHEVGHVLRSHGDRAAAAGVDVTTKHAWNVAADAEINDDLIADGVTLPHGGILPRTLHLPASRAAEYYFEHLRGRGALPPCSCGEGAHGIGTFQHSDTADLASGIGSIEQDLIRRLVALDIVAFTRGKQAGTGAGGWVRWAEGLLHPVVDWRQALRTSIRKGVFLTAGRVDYSYRRPSRRPVPNVILPSLVQPVPQVSVVLDTSGSMDGMLSIAWTEVLGILRSLGSRRQALTVWAGDTDASLVRNVAARVQLIGGGGTDLRIGIGAALAARPRPDLLIVLTDGYTPWPAKPPAQPVIVGLVSNNAICQRPPSWARVIEIKLD
jgi:predicted metal-dependent peptidase